MKIKYHNMCSIRDAEVEFEPGKLICIRGESNQGKSAMFYTLESALLNNTDFKRFINNQALKEDPKAFGQIILTDDEGNKWDTKATTGSFRYKVSSKKDAIKFEKCGRKNIFELMETQIPALLYDPENNSPIMNMLGEDSGLFPIDRSDAQIFKTYERLLSLSCTEDILRSIKLDMEDIDYQVTDRLNGLQESRLWLDRITKFMKDVPEKEVDEIIKHLSDLATTYNNSVALYNQTVRDANYADAVDKVQMYTDTDTFDTQGFQNLLQSLTKSIKDTKYIAKVDEIWSDTMEDFNIENAVQWGQWLSLAQMLENEIDTLEKTIIADTKELEDIQSILHTIKICPMCGHKMED